MRYGVDYQTCKYDKHIWAWTTGGGYNGEDDDGIEGIDYDTKPWGTSGPAEPSPD